MLQKKLCYWHLSRQASTSHRNDQICYSGLTWTHRETLTVSTPGPVCYKCRQLGLTSSKSRYLQCANTDLWMISINPRGPHWCPWILWKTKIFWQCILCIFISLSNLYLDPSTDSKVWRTPTDRAQTSLLDRFRLKHSFRKANGGHQKKCF